MNTFELSTTNHDADGTPGTKTVHKDHLQKVLEYILVQNHLSTLERLFSYDACNNKNVDVMRSQFELLLKRKTNLFEVLVDYGVFTKNKWDFRTKWSMDGI